MLRPCFERHQVADTSLFAKHMDRFITVLPTDGTIIDLQPLCHELTLDIATEFLFGRSTDSLKREEKTNEVAEFVEAFEYCADPFLSEQYDNGDGWDCCCRTRSGRDVRKLSRVTIVCEIILPPILTKTQILLTG
jgi:hypothetical protein